MSRRESARPRATVARTDVARTGVARTGVAQPDAARIDVARIDWPPWFEGTATGVRLRLHVQPGATRSAVIGSHGERLKIALQAPPTQGRANLALLKLLATLLEVRADALTLAAGAGSREKTIAISCAAADAAPLLARLLAAGSFPSPACGRGPG